MKKIIIVIMILLIAGAIVGVTGSMIYLLNGGVMKNAVEKSKKIVYNGENLSVDAIFDKIEVKVVDGNEVTFDYFESEKVKRTIKNESEKISFETEAPRFLNWSFNQYVLKIGLPKNFDGKLEIETKTGSVLVNLNAVTCKEISIECTTGNVTVKSVTVKEGFSAKVTTGNIEVNGVASDNFSIESTTGNIKANNLSAKEVKVKLTTGSLKEGKIDCENFLAEATTGSLSFKVKNATKVSLKATTGSISGEIVGNEKEFNIESSTSTGKNNLKNQTVLSSDKLIKAQTSTGSITIHFSQE